jgi:hypothetical protein
MSKQCVAIIKVTDSYTKYFFYRIYLFIIEILILMQYFFYGVFVTLQYFF